MSIEYTGDGLRELQGLAEDHRRATKCDNVISFGTHVYFPCDLPAGHDGWHRHSGKNGAGDPYEITWDYAPDGE